MGIPLQVFTHSSLVCWRTCHWKYNLRYVLGLRKERAAEALRVGGAFGKGLEALNLGKTLDEAAAIATAGYDDMPGWANAQDWEVERVTIETLLAGWAWRWQAENAKLNFKPEMVFRMTVRRPLVNRTVELAGKVDALIWGVQIDGLPFDMMEFKTAGEEIEGEEGKKFWDRLRNDPQISIYRKLMESNGYHDGRIFYDVTRKPNIEPLLIPTLDTDGVKIVLDAAGQRVRTKDGKKWRESGDASMGYTLQARRQTPQEFGERLLADIQARPNWYYQRREIPRIDAQVDRTIADACSDINDILRAKKNGKYSHSHGRMTCDYCDYKGPCHAGYDPGAWEDGALHAPEGFEFATNVHPELETDDGTSI